MRVLGVFYVLVGVMVVFCPFLGLKPTNVRSENRKQNRISFIVLKPASSAVGSDESFLYATTQEKACFSHIALSRCLESLSHEARITTKLGERMLH